MFRVRFISPANKRAAILTSSLCKFHILQAFSKLTATAEYASIKVPVIDALLCFAPTVQNLLHLCGGILGPDSWPRGFVKSALLSAPAGGGKSSVLGTVATLCEQRYSGVVVLRASCKNVEQRGDSSQQEDSSPLGRSDDWGDSLLQVLRLLGIEYPHNKRQYIKSGRILLCLDDMDAVFANYSSRKDDNLEYNSNSDTYRQLGYHLSCLIRTLSSPNSDANVLVLGCSRRDSTELLRAHTGCPEFEKCFVLCSPTYTERALILETLLTDCQLTFQSIIDGPSSECASTEGSQKEVRRKWAARLAGLSAGYLPGDLAAVAQRILFVHRGRTAARHHSSSQASGQLASAPESVPWNTALEAVVSVVPLTLQQLGVQGNSVRQSGGGGSVRLSWSDFAGYTALVADLKRRLAPRAAMSVTSTPPTSSDTAAATQATTTNADATSSAGKTLRGALLRGIVLHGPSGCGKTLLASVITSEVSYFLNSTHIHFLVPLTPFFSTSYTSHAVAAEDELRVGAVDGPAVALLRRDGEQDPGALPAGPRRRALRALLRRLRHPGAQEVRQ